MRPELLIGVDVGGSKIAALAAAAGGPALGRAELPTDVATPERTLDGIVAAVERALGAVPALVADVAAIGLGIPGRVQPDSGLVESAVNLGWRQLPVGGLLSERFGVPCFLENDSRAAALGAYQAPGENGFQNWAYISVGTGIGAGIILGGQLYRGPNGMAGEIGHIVMQPGGPRCGCGLNGCLEALAAGPAIGRQARVRLDAAPQARAESSLGAYEAPTAKQVYLAASEGDALALAVTRQAARYLAQAVHGLVMTCDVQRVVFGGGVARAGGAFLNPIGEALDELRASSPLAAEVLRPGLIGLMPPDYEAGLWGALMVAQGEA